jgi:uncharacterized membrane protein
MKDPRNERQNDLWQRDPNNWRGGVFYFNRRDPRVMVPKRNPTMGWTLNFGNPISWLILASIAVLIIVSLKL